MSLLAEHGNADVAFALSDVLAAARDLYGQDGENPEHNRALIEFGVPAAGLPFDPGSEIVRSALDAR